MSRKSTRFEDRCRLDAGAPDGGAGRDLLPAIQRDREGVDAYDAPPHEHSDFQVRELSRRLLHDRFVPTREDLLPRLHDRHRDLVGIDLRITIEKHFLDQIPHLRGKLDAGRTGAYHDERELLAAPGRVGLACGPLETIDDLISDLNGVR